MKYMLLIYADTSDWDSLSEDEQTAIHREYMAITDDPAVTDDNQLQPAMTATTVRVRRRDADDRRAVRRDEGGARRLLPRRGRRPRRRAGDRLAHPGCPQRRCRRDPAGGGALA